MTNEEAGRGALQSDSDSREQSPDISSEHRIRSDSELRVSQVNNYQIIKSALRQTRTLNRMLWPSDRHTSIQLQNNRLIKSTVGLSLLRGKMFVQVCLFGWCNSYLCLFCWFQTDVQVSVIAEVTFNAHSMHIASLQVSLLFTELPSFSWTLTFSLFWHFWKPERFFYCHCCKALKSVTCAAGVGGAQGWVTVCRKHLVFVCHTPLHSGLSSPLALCCQWWPPAGPVMIPPSHHLHHYYRP